MAPAGALGLRGALRPEPGAGAGPHRRRFPAQLVLSDYHLDDGKTGLQALHMIRLAYGNEIGGIIISADRKSELQAQIREHGFGYVSKPVKAPQAAGLMNSLLLPVQ